MAKVWINPAFKNKFPTKKETKPEEKKAEKKEVKKKEPEKKAEKKKKPQKKKPPVKFTPSIELKLFQYFVENQVPLEIKLSEGKNKITGKIKWFSQWRIGFETDKKKPKYLIFHRLRMIYYKPLKEINLSEKEIEKTLSKIGKIDMEQILELEIQEFQNLKDNKTPLTFHMRDNIKLKGTLEWHEKLLYYIKSLDEKEEYSIPRSSVVYTEVNP